MVIMTLSTLIAGGESLRLEFKRGDINDRVLYEAVVCLANGEGGTVVIGVDDDGSILGAAPRHGTRTEPDRLAAAIQNNTEPPIGVAVGLDEVQGAELIVIEVPRAEPGPAGTKKGLFVKRALGPDGRPACVAMTPQELVSRAYVTRGIDYAAAPAEGATFEDLDPGEFQRFRRLCSRTDGDPHLAELGDRDLCVALGLVPRTDPVSLGMVLLFGAPDALARWVPTAELLFQDDRMASTPVNERFRWPLLRMAEEVQMRLEQRNSTTEVLVGIQRIDVPLISGLTRRESVANAIVHRDYSVLGPITVRLSDATFTVTNPGGFPPGVTISNILEQSRPRSLLLADVFKRAGLVERKGKGVNEMFESQLRAGRDVPEYSRTTSEAVVLSVPLSTSDLEVVRFLATLQTEQQRNLSLPELRVVHEVKNSGASTSLELADQLTLSPSTVRAVATSLVEAGFLEARGSGRMRRFHLTPQFYALSQDKAAYVRVRPMEPLQQEQMILDYVRAYGRITRSQAAELCHISPTAARRVLKRLTDAGKLQLRGQRRGAHYVLATAA